MVEVEVLFDYKAEQSDELTIKKGQIIKNVDMVQGGWWEGELNGKQGIFPENFVKVIDKSGKQKEKHKKKEKDKDSGGKVSELKNKLAKDIPTAGGDNVQKRDGGKRCRVLFSYTPQHDDELKLVVDDTLEIISQDEEGWFKGKDKNGTVGVFPSNFVEELPTSQPTENGSPSVAVVPPVVANAAEAPQQPSSVEASSAAADIKGKKVQGVGLGNIFSGDPIRLRGADAAEAQGKTEAGAPPAAVRYRAAFSYHAANDDELSLAVGDEVIVLDKESEDAGWWKGRHARTGAVGVFPDNFVEPISPSATVEASPKSSVRRRDAPATASDVPVSTPPTTTAPTAVPPVVATTTTTTATTAAAATTATPAPVDTTPAPPAATTPPGDREPSPPRVTSVAAAIAAAEKKKLALSGGGPPPVAQKPKLGSVRTREADGQQPQQQRSASVEALGGAPLTTSTGSSGSDSERARQQVERLNSLDQLRPSAAGSGGRLNHVGLDRPRQPGKRPPTRQSPTPDAELQQDPPAAVNAPPDRPPPPRPAAVSDASSPPAAAVTPDAGVSRDEHERLRAEHVQLRGAFDALRSEFHQFKQQIRRQLAELQLEVDEEKKLRLAAQVDMERVKRLTLDIDSSKA